MGGLFVELGRVGTFPAQDIAAEFDYRNLQPQADAEVRFVSGTSIVCGEDFTFDSTVTEAPRDEHTIGGAQGFPSTIVTGFL